MMDKYACRICGNQELKEILSFGDTPLANSLLPYDQLSEVEPYYPLELVFCPQCTLAQITETVSPEILFKEYLYFSSYSDTLLAHAASLVEQLVGSRNLTSDSLVVEIASNDGYLLKNYVLLEIPVLGVEPADNIASVASQQGVRTWNEFFNFDLANRIVDELGQADVIHANNVLAHVADLHGVIQGIAHVLRPEGIAVLEVPYVRDMIQHSEFDTIYHEHLCYFSLTALKNLFQMYDLLLLDVEQLKIHGGSIRVTVGKQGKPTSVVFQILEEEVSEGLIGYDFYFGFRERVLQLREELIALLDRLHGEGSRIVAYGASAKGSTLLNYFGIGKEMIEYVVDRSPVKQGLYTPGTHLPIKSPETLLADNPDYVLLLTWNFVDEILEQQREYLQQGGHFIVPIPEVRVV